MNLLTGIAAKRLAMIAELATEENLAELIPVYTEYFGADDDDEPALDLESELSFKFKDAVVGDLGMEVEATAPPDALSHALGFIRHRLPHQFNLLRHKRGITPWEQPELFNIDLDAALSPDRTQFDPAILSSLLPDYMQPNELHWHQLAGTHSAIRTTRTAEPDPQHCRGMLIADEVGLGKTALCLTTAAFINQAIKLQAEKKPLPPILRESLPRIILHITN